MKQKESLLYEVFNASSIPHKYSKSFLNLSVLMELEKEDEFKFDKNILDEFEEIKKLYNDFMSGIPLVIIEQYYLRNSTNLNKPLYIEYQKKQIIDKKVIDFYILLEDFYNKIFLLGSKIGNLYNLEIKVNVKTNDQNNSFV